MQDTMLYVKDTANIQICSIFYRKIVPVRCTTLNLCYYKQLYFKNESWATGYVGLRELAISHFDRDVNLPFATVTHLLHCNNPTLYQFVQTEHYWCSNTTAVELLSVYSPPGVAVCGDDSVGRRMPAVVLSLADDLVIDSFWERFYTLFLCFFLQLILVGLFVFFFAYFISDFLIGIWYGVFLYLGRQQYGYQKIPCQAALPLEWRPCFPDECYNIQLVILSCQKHSLWEI